MSLINKLSAFINFTYQEGIQKNGSYNHSIPNIANIKANAGLTVKVKNLFSISIIENWIGDKHTLPTNPVGKVGSYYTTNIVLFTNTLFDDRVTACINIRNLFNQTYYDPGIRLANGALFSTVLEQPGINAIFKLGIRLK